MLDLDIGIWSLLLLVGAGIVSGRLTRPLVGTP